MSGKVVHTINPSIQEEGRWGQWVGISEKASQVYIVKLSLKNKTKLKQSKRNIKEPRSTFTTQATKVKCEVHR